MVWRQGQSYSEDLRARVLAAIDGGMAARSAASVFRVSVSYIYKAVIRRRRTGEVSASSRRGHRPRKLMPAQEAALATHIAPIRISHWRRCKPGWRASTRCGSRTGRCGRPSTGWACHLKKDTPRRRAGPAGRCRPAPHLAGGAALC